jgi:mono/diheme cytochrome c family protein
LTEIPEHLLKRSRERRAALGLGGDAPEGGASTPATPSDAPPAEAATPTPAAPPAPVEEPKPEPPKPVPAYIQAAQRRRRVPYWAMPVLAALPLWAYVFFGTLEPQPDEASPLSLGGEIYSGGGCAGCHGGGGAGQGNAPGFTDGAVVETWPDFRDHMMWVRLGSEGWPGSSYGDQGKPKNGGMPAHPNLSDEELAQVVLYERQELAGFDSEVEEEELLLIAEGEMTFEEAGLGSVSEAAGVSEDNLAGGGG